MDTDFYTEFENSFRGSREQIIKILSNYDGLIDYILKKDNEPSLLDIGSGRGEWMQKCNAKGFKSVGLELDPQMVKDCRGLNLNVIQGDALELLDKFSEDSFSIVSAFHIIEHMNHENLQELLIKSKRILKSDGFLILETPSIDNLVVSTKSFYIDPTHINPIHPDLLDFLVKRIGFTEVKYYFINGGPLQNSESDSLTRVFNGVAQDLVLLASKSNYLNNSFFAESNSITKDFKLGITTLEAAIDFDNYSRNRYAEYDEAIFILRKRIIDLERKLQRIVDIYNISLFSIIRKVLIKIKRTIFSFKIKSMNIFKTLFRYFLNNKLFAKVITKLYKINSLFFVMRYIEKLIDNHGYRIYQYQLIRRSIKRKEDIELVFKNDRQLEIYFDSSKDAKQIFNDLKKCSKR